MAAILEARNNALLANGPQYGSQQLTTGGSSWLWAVTAVFFLSFLIFAFLVFFRPHNNERIFHYIFLTALIVGTIAYYAQAAGLAYLVVRQSNQLWRGPDRQIHWAKYVYWVVSFPLVASALGLLSGVSFATIIFNVFLTWAWIISYLVAAFTPSNYKWGFFAIGTLSWLLLTANLLFHGRRSASRFGAGVGRDHTLLVGWTAFLWGLYVLGWALADGGNRIGVTGSFIWFGILDLLFVPVLAFAFLVLARRWDYGALNLYFTQYGRVRRGSDYPEKGPAPVAEGAGGAATGAATGPAAGQTPATSTAPAGEPAQQTV